MPAHEQVAKLRACLAELILTNPIEVRTQRHLTDASVVVRCVICGATERGVFFAWFQANTVLRHGINCAWLNAVEAFPDLYRPR